MRVKIGAQWYSSNDQPICIQVSKGEQRQIAEMDRTVAVHGKYAVFPNAGTRTPEQMLQWMDEPPEGRAPSATASVVQESEERAA